VHEDQFVKVGLPGSERTVIAKTMWKVDTTLFKVFNFALTSGETTRSPQFLDAHVSSTFSKALFDNEEQAIGSEILVAEEVYIIKGVVSNDPDTDLNFDVMVFSDIESDWVTTFVKLFPPGHTSSAVEDKISVLLREQLAGEYNEKALNLGFSLESLEDLHFTKASFNSFRAADRSLITILFWSSIVLIFSSAFNSLNLTVAGSLSRIKEISLRKIYGARNFHLLLQSATEVSMTILLSLILAMIIFGSSKHAVSNFLGFPILMDKSLDTSIFVVFSLVVALLVIISTGLHYYSFFGVINGSLFARDTHAIKRRFSALVVLQMVVCFFLLCVTFFVSGQIRLIREVSLSSHYDNSIVLRFPKSESYQRLQQFKNEVVSASFVHSSTLCKSNSILGSQPELELFKLDGAPEGDAFMAKMLVVDKDYFEAMGIALPVDHIKDLNWHKQFVLSKKAQRMAGDSVEIGFDRMNNRNIAGVSDGFNWTSYKGVEPIVFLLDTTNLNSMIIRFRSKASDSDIAFINQLWDRFFPDLPFDYESLSQINAKTYENEFLLNSLLSVISAVTYIISVIGILSISSMTTVRKLKEFSIRRIFGASISNLAVRLCYNLGKLFLISLAVTLPLVYISLNQWLERFSNRVEVSGFTISLIFLVFSLSSLLLNIGFVSRLLHTNPINALRNS
jgi:putative ABC transport system permease protein